MTVRRLARSVLLLTILTVPAAAQNPAPRLGVLGGVNVAKLTGDETDFLDSRTGFLAGAFGEFSLSPKVAIDLQALYSQKGATASEAGFDLTLKLDYFQFPVLLKYQFGSEASSVRPHLFLGPALAFRASCKVAASYPDLDDIPAGSFEVDCSEGDNVGSFKGSDFSGIVGAGLAIGNFRLGARYDAGFTNIADVVSQGETSIKTGTLSVYGGYGFRLR